MLLVLGKIVVVVVVVLLVMGKRQRFVDGGWGDAISDGEDCRCCCCCVGDWEGVVVMESCSVGDGEGVVLVMERCCW